MNKHAVNKGAKSRNTLIIVETKCLQIERLLRDAVLGQDAAMVRLEQLIRLEFDGDWPVSQHFFENLLFGNFSPALANISSFLDFGRGLARLIVRASQALRLSFVWCAVVGHHVAAFVEVGVQMWPAAFAALVEEIALHDLLG